MVNRHYCISQIAKTKNSIQKLGQFLTNNQSMGFIYMKLLLFYYPPINTSKCNILSNNV